jgi:two-component system cell cycle sensor histidine kinase PleC
VDPRADTKPRMGNRRDFNPRKRAWVLACGIAAVVTAVCIAMGAAAIISINESQEAALKNMRADAANLAFAFDEDMTHTLDTVEGAMEAVANRMAARQSKMDLYAWSQQFPIITGPTVEAVIISPEGKIIAASWTRKPAPKDLSDQEYFQKQRRAGINTVFVGKPAKSPGSGQMLIPISERVKARNGSFVGVLTFFIAPVKLTSLYKSLYLGRDGAIALTGTDGVILTRFSKSSPAGLEGAGAPLIRRTGQEFTPENSGGSYIQRSTIDGVTRLYAYRRGWDYPVIVAVGLDYEEGLATARAHARMLYLLTVSATLLLGGCALYLIREIHVRANRDIELMQERVKLQAANAELVVSAERAEVANRAKSLFLANMTHELKTPLNAIIGFSQIIKDQIIGPVGKPAYAEYASDICHAGEHLLEIVSNLLDISRIEAGKIDLKEDLFDPADLVSGSLAAVRVQAEKKNLELLVDIPSMRPLVRGDALRLRQILINLLSNAVKFTEAGSVRVSLACDADGAFSITVGDTGIGMSPDEIATALEPFGQVENAITKKYEGTGLGLPLARHLAELHGGSIAITSVKGAGSSVRVQLPADRVVWRVPQAAE